MADDMRHIPELVGRLFQNVRELGEYHPDRRFTLDGHLVGSIGEVVAEYVYGLILEPASTKGFDARTLDGQTVQIKLTGCKCVSVSSDPDTPNLLVVMRLDQDTGFEEVYNGTFPRELWESKRASSRRTKSLTICQLRAINPGLLAQMHPLDELNRHFPAAANAEACHAEASGESVDH